VRSLVVLGLGGVGHGELPAWWDALEGFLAANGRGGQPSRGRYGFGVGILISQCVFSSVMLYSIDIDSVPVPTSLLRFPRVCNLLVQSPADIRIPRSVPRLPVRMRLHRLLCALVIILPILNTANFPPRHCNIDTISPAEPGKTLIHIYDPQPRDTRYLSRGSVATFIEFHACPSTRRRPERRGNRDEHARY
jgi:hypothetical protein